MANNVFANGREISCKAADGKSICAFPDVCLSPPSPPAGPIPIPYPNTAFAKDTTSGSKTVKINNKEVMLKRKSYFKKSTGDEAATKTLGMGVITHQITGKVYFASWSPDVKFEGQNVVRHLDLTTHNHMSDPGNSPTWPYLDSAAFSDANHPCNKMANEVHDKCQGHITNNSTSKGVVKRPSAIKAMCEDKDCKKARKCVLSPEKPKNCCDNKTPHHLIPAHCFMPPGERGKRPEKVYPGCEKYNSRKAPCICVQGEGKIGEHGKFHNDFDARENAYMQGNQAQSGSWTYNQALKAAIETVEKHKKECNPDCVKSQINAYHQGGGDKSPNIEGGTYLRADSSGNKTPEAFIPSSTTAVKHC